MGVKMAVYARTLACVCVCVCVGGEACGGGAWMDE